MQTQPPPMLELPFSATREGPPPVAQLKEHFQIHIDDDDGGVELRTVAPLPTDDPAAEPAAACELLEQAMHLRARYKSLDKGQNEIPSAHTAFFEDPQWTDRGVMAFMQEQSPLPSWSQFYSDVVLLDAVATQPACAVACKYRLSVLEEKFNLHRLLNADVEEQRRGPDKSGKPGAFFGVSQRVDNNVCLQGGMSARALLSAIQNSCSGPRNVGDCRVRWVEEEGRWATLREFFADLQVKPSALTINRLGLQPESEKTFSRFDALDSEHNRSGETAALILQAFLSYQVTQGHLLARVTRPLLLEPITGVDVGAVRHQELTEFSIPVVGLSTGPARARRRQSSRVAIGRGEEARMQRSEREPRSRPGSATGHLPQLPLPRPQHRACTGFGSTEWQDIARWLQTHDMVTDRNLFIVDVLRTRTVPEHIAAQGAAEGIGSDLSRFVFETHEEHLEALFAPLFRATLDPDQDGNPVAWMLCNIGGFSIRSEDVGRPGWFQRDPRPPASVPWNEPVCDLYFAYYFWVNLTSLNMLRKRKGLNTLQLRCSAGAKPLQMDTMLYGYLLCDSISNGVLLEQYPVLQYLYGINSVGVAMSPTAMNNEDTPYMQCPFFKYYRQGLRVALCTDNPLMSHHSDRPLLEEYATAAKMYKLTAVDINEIARNSVLMSSFPVAQKQQWLGERFNEGANGNTVELSGVPDSRIALRDDCWEAERAIVTAAVSYVARRRRISLAGILGDDDTTWGGLGAFDAREDLLAAARLQPDKCPFPMIGNLAVYSTTDPRVKYPRIKVVGPVDLEDLEASRAVLEADKARLESIISERAHHSGHGGQLQEALDMKWVLQHKLNDLRAKSARNTAATKLRDALELRQRYVFEGHSWRSRLRPSGDSKGAPMSNSKLQLASTEGVVVAYQKHSVPRFPDHLFTFDDFRQHMASLKTEVLDNVHVKSLSFQRLTLLENRFRLHQAVCHSAEASSTEERQSANRDFYQTVKVDTAVRMETGMTSRQLLNFLVSKAKHNSDDIVGKDSAGAPQTLRSMLQRLSIDPDRLTVDDLNVQADATGKSSSEDFLPDGRDELLTLLLKTDNEMRGRYFAELTKLTFEQLRRDQFTFAENRLVVYGQSRTEFSNLAGWFDTHGMACYNNRWMVQLPRIYGALFRKGAVHSFAEYLDNIFLPLWEVTLDPAPNAKLFHFLGHVSGFDCVEDESVLDVPLTNLPKPHEWKTADNPPYAYYVYYLWVNVRTLNEFRASRNFSTFSFRPSCGEAGSVDHLLAGFLTASAVSYGVTLKLDPVLQYLYYLAQVGISVCPLSNNTKILEYLDNPFASFFRRGLNVSLATDSPLQYHHTQEPLIEEYSVASKVWKLSPTDMCEVARNSVMQSGFDEEFKKRCLGPLYFLSSSHGNDEGLSHLSPIRIAYRWETYHAELSQLDIYVQARADGSGGRRPLPRAMMTEDEEMQLLTHLGTSTNATAEVRSSAETPGPIRDEGEAERLRKQVMELHQQREKVRQEYEANRVQNTLLLQNLEDAKAKHLEVLRMMQASRILEQDSPQRALSPRTLGRRSVATNSVVGPASGRGSFALPASEGRFTPSPALDPQTDLESTAVEDRLMSTHNSRGLRSIATAASLATGLANAGSVANLSSRSNMSSSGNTPSGPGPQGSGVQWSPSQPVEPALGGRPGEGSERGSRWFSRADDPAALSPPTPGARPPRGQSTPRR